MLFNSFSFLAFFTLVVVVYYATAHEYRWLLLLGASLYFYAALNPGYIVLLLGITLVAYVAGRALGSSSGTARNVILAIGVIVPLAAMAVFKVPGTGLAAVAGLSFYTFSCVSYVADVYAGRVPAERHAGRLALYVAFFPKLLTFHLILVTWVFFRASSLSDAATILSRIAASVPSLPAALPLRLTSADMLLSLGLIVMLLVVEALDEGKPFWEQVRLRPLPVRWAVYYALLFALIVLGSWDLQQFVYMQF